MNNTPLISAEALSRLLEDPSRDILVCDCRFDLANPAAGEESYRQGHIPTAVYIHLDQVLSAAKTGKNGRHPLPSREALANAMSALGVNNDTLVVAYDANDSMFAARLWWMLRWIGHENVVVLDGGLKAWTELGRRVTPFVPESRTPGNLQLKDSLVNTVDYSQVLTNVQTKKRLVVDARSADRFRGENETIDPKAGHIPGARNRFFKDNLLDSGKFKPADQLRTEFASVFDGRAPKEIISQCGSGVTACHNLLAMEAAGLNGAALYPGSWSEWCAQEGAPVEHGAL